MLKLLVLTYITFCHAGIIKNIINYSSNFVNFDILGALSGTNSAPVAKNYTRNVTEKASIINEILNEVDGLAHLQNEYPDLYEAILKKANKQQMLSYFDSSIEVNVSNATSNSTTGFSQAFRKIDEEINKILKSIKNFFSSVLENLNSLGINSTNSTSLIQRTKNSWDEFMSKFYNMTVEQKNKVINSFKNINKPNTTQIQTTIKSNNIIFQNLFNETNKIIHDMNTISIESQLQYSQNNHHHLKIALGCVALLVVLGGVIFLLTNYYRQPSEPTDDQESMLKESLYQKTQALQFKSNKKKGDDERESATSIDEPSMFSK